MRYEIEIGDMRYEMRNRRYEKYEIWEIGDSRNRTDEIWDEK